MIKSGHQFAGLNFCVLNNIFVNMFSRSFPRLPHAKLPSTLECRLAQGQQHGKSAQHFGLFSAVPALTTDIFYKNLDCKYLTLPACTHTPRPVMITQNFHNCSWCWKDEPGYCYAYYLRFTFLYCCSFLSSVLTHPHGPSLARLLTTDLIGVIGMNSEKVWWHSMSCLELATSCNILQVTILFYLFL